MESDISSEATSDTAGIRPRLYGIVHTYIQKRLPRDIHPAFKALRNREEAAVTLPQIDSTEETTLPMLGEREQRLGIDQMGGYKDDDDDLPLEELYKDAASEKRLFKTAIETYERTTKGSKYRTNISSEATHTWEEVLTEVDAASERYNDVSSFWGKIRKGLRSFGSNSQVFDAWTGLLPTQSQYLSILCGGLKLIFSAAGRLQDLRSEICEALAEIPILLASTHRALGAFKKSKELHQCSAALYCATIAALRHIVEWYQEKAMKKFSKSLFKQSSYEQQLIDLIQAVRTHSQRFDTCARLCSYETIVHTNGIVRSHQKDSQNHHQETVGKLDRLKIDTFQQNRLLGNVVATEAGNIQNMVGMMASRLEMSENNIKELIETTVKTTLENFLSSSDRMDYRTQDVRGPMLPVRKVASESQLLRERQNLRQHLLTGLESEVSVLDHDVEAKLRTIWALPRQDQDRAVVIMRSPQLQKWITATESSALLINANQKGSTAQQPTSFICAKLIDSITPSPSDAQPEYRISLPLAFFCGEHLQRDDPDSGPDGMMRNLLAQLLLAYRDFDLRTVQRMQNLNYNDVDDLCDVFDLLIAQLPPHIVVFCVLDAVSFYEDNATVCEEARIVVRALVDVVERTKENGCAFKLLLMSPWNSRSLYKELDDQEGEVLWMPAKVPAQGGFTSMKWNASMGSNFDA